MKFLQQEANVQEHAWIHMVRNSAGYEFQERAVIAEMVMLETHLVNVLDRKNVAVDSHITEVLWLLVNQ